MKKIILQGLPAIGKTTLTKKIAEKLKDMGVEVIGFYTEELRDKKNVRLGFDIISLDNERGILARKNSGMVNPHRVGMYDVYLDNFEKIALPIFDKLGSVIIIDEIGKMELFSKKFQMNVEKVIADPNVFVIATVPLKGGAPLIHKIKNNKDHHLITVKLIQVSVSNNEPLFQVTATNRNKLLEDIIPLITT